MAVTRIDALPLPPLPCLFAAVRQADRSVAQFFDARLIAAGMRTTQFATLFAVSRLQPVSHVRLATTLGLEPSTVTRNVELLIRKSWLRSLSSADRRVRHLELTARGRAAFERAFPVWEAGQAELEALLGRSIRELLRTLNGVATVARDHARPRARRRPTARAG